MRYSVNHSWTLSILAFLTILLVISPMSESLSSVSSSSSSSEDMLFLEDRSAEPAPSSSLQVNGDSVSFEALGPMVLNADGTISRITNWATLSDHEKATTFRLISKRNEQRRKALEQAQRDEEYAAATAIAAATATAGSQSSSSCSASSSSTANNDLYGDQE